MLAPLLSVALVLGQTPLPVAPTVSIPVFPSGTSQTVNILQWDTNKLPKVYERSEQLPITDEELVKLSKEGFDAKDLVKMIEERRCNCDASADGLIKMKRAGVSKEVLSAVSLHGLKPNRAFTLVVTLDFTGDGNEARQSYLHFFVDDGDVVRPFTVNLNDVLSKRNTHDEMVDKSDLMITKRVRRVTFANDIALKKYGKHNVLVVASGNPTLQHPSQLSEIDKKNAKAFTFDYPRTSLESVCRLTAGYKRDVMLAYQWKFMGSLFQCEWD